MRATKRPADLATPLAAAVLGVEARSDALVALETLDEIRDACAVAVPERLRIQNLESTSQALTDRILTVMETDELAPVPRDLRAAIHEFVEATYAVRPRARRDREAVLGAAVHDACARERLQEAERWWEIARDFGQAAREILQESDDEMDADAFEESLAASSDYGEAANEAAEVLLALTLAPDEADADLQSATVLPRFLDDFQAARSRVADLVQRCPGDLPLERLPEYRVRRRVGEDAGAAGL